MLRLYEDLSHGSCYLRIRGEEWGKLKQFQGHLTTLTGKAEHSTSKIMMMAVIMILMMALVIEKNREGRGRES